MEFGRSGEHDASPTAEEIEAFANIAVAQDVTAAIDFIYARVDAHRSLETVLLELLAPTARWLRDQWLTDRRSFADVTLGLGTLEQIVRSLGV